jgi:hypothetical protein
MALKLSFSLPVLDLESFEKRILKKYADVIKQELRDATPGQAKALWIDRNVPEGVLISNKSHYLPFIVRGTGIYGPNHTMIIPKTKKALHWIQDGKDVFVVKSRGMKPNPFISGAVERGMRRVYADI